MSETGNSKRFRVDDAGISEQQKNPTDPNGQGVITEHPLNNDLILGIIFDLLSKKNWKCFRLVNKTWLSTLQPRWRDGMKYKLGLGETWSYPFPDINTFTVNYLEQQHPTNNPADQMQLDRYPIRNISIDCCYNRAWFILLQPDQTRFWELFGAGLKRLHLEGIRIHQGALFKRFLVESTPSLEEFNYHQCFCDDIDQLELNTVAVYAPPDKLQKNLKYLHLTTLEVGNKPQFPISWIEFFSVFPNIQKLNLEIGPLQSKSPIDFLRLFEAVGIIREANNNKVLNIIELNTGKVRLSFVDLMKILSVFASLPIAILRMDVACLTNETIIVLIQMLTSFLRDLTLIKSPYNKDKLPKNVLPKGLTKLSLRGHFFSSFEFLSCTPQLEELRMENIRSMIQPEECENLNDIAPLVNLKKFDFTISDEKYPSAGINILAKVMPNVVKCTCEVPPEGFQALVWGWPNLEHLDLRINFKNEDFFVKDLIQLKRLQSLKIDSDDVTDKSVFKGFLKLPLLAKIQLKSTHEITNKGLKALHENGMKVSSYNSGTTD